MLSNVGISKYFGLKLWRMLTCYLVNRLSSSVIGGKTPLEFWSGKVAQDYDSLWVFECPAYYHVKEDKLDSRARKYVFLGFKKGVECYKIWDLMDKKFILSRDVTFNEALMMKPTNSKQVESEKTEGISQQMKSDATSSFLERSISLEIIPAVTHGGDHIANEDANDDED